MPMGAGHRCCSEHADANGSPASWSNIGPGQCCDETADADSQPSGWSSLNWADCTAATISLGYEYITYQSSGAGCYPTATCTNMGSKAGCTNSPAVYQGVSWTFPTNWVSEAWAPCAARAQSLGYEFIMYQSSATPRP